MPVMVRTSGEMPTRAKTVTIGSMIKTVLSRSWSVSVTFSGAGDGVLMMWMLSNLGKPVKNWTGAR